MFILRFFKFQKAKYKCLSESWLPRPEIIVCSFGKPLPLRSLSKRNFSNVFNRKKRFGSAQKVLEQKIGVDDKLIVRETFKKLFKRKELFM